MNSVRNLNKRNRVGHCPICGAKDVFLTKDHIIPKWAIKMGRGIFLNIGLKRKEVQEFVSDGVNIRYICANCNFAKGGRIDLSHSHSLQFWEELHKKLGQAIHEEKLRKGSS